METTIRAIMNRPLRIESFGPDYDGNLKPKFSPQQLVIILDNSGSTNNKHGGSRRGNQQFESDPNVEPQSPTPEIIIAECEGVCILLLEYMRAYDMTGTTIHLIPFSSLYSVLKFTIESNIDLYQKLITQIDILFNYEQGGTNLLSPINYVSDKILSETLHTHIILATDGQPESKQEVLNVLNNIKSNFSIFVIGAGSIQESIGSKTRSCANGIVNPRDHQSDTVQLNPLLLSLTLVQLTDSKLMRTIISKPDLMKLTEPPVRANTSGLECDIEYLEQIAYAKTAKFGFYAGAFGDYSVLKGAVGEWLEAHLHTNKKVIYRVVLDNGICAPLPSTVSDALALHSAVLIKTQYGYYLITSYWQIAIDSSKTPNIPDFLECDPVNPIMQMDYGILKDVKPQRDLIINLGSMSATPLLDSDGFYRIRQISKI